MSFLNKISIIVFWIEAHKSFIFSSIKFGFSLTCFWIKYNIEVYKALVRTKNEEIEENNDEILALKKSFDENSNEYIEQLQNSIKERESQIMEADNEIKRLQNEVGILKPQQSKFRDLTYDEIWCNSKQLTSKSSRTFKLFGIPIFSIDNK